jgi:hypothetical protein
MIKWAAEFWRVDDDRRPGQDDDFDYVEEEIFQSTPHLVQVVTWSIFRRRMAFQQFWYQRSFDLGAVPRQALIFGRLMQGSDVMQSFEREAGINAADFVREMAAMVAQAGVMVGGHEHLADLAPDPERRDSEHWSKMSRFFVVTPAQLHERVKRLAAFSTPRSVELCEQTALIRTPFITTSIGDECIHHQLLFQALSTALYDLLRDRGAEAFMRVFGPAFEDYLALILNEQPYTVVRETALKARLTSPGRCVDFALVSEDALLLIDAKGIEGHYDERYHHMTEVLTDKLRSTAIRAVDQGVQTARRLPDDLRRPLTFFVCVTYKQLNIGDGPALHELTAGTTEWDEDHWRAPELPPEHMFTISVAEFELLCGVLRSGISLREVIADILERAAMPTTRLFLFEQYLAKYGLVDIPQCARDAARELCGI